MHIDKETHMYEKRYMHARVLVPCLLESTKVPKPHVQNSISVHIGDLLAMKHIGFPVFQMTSHSNTLTTTSMWESASKTGNQAGLLHLYLIETILCQQLG